MAQIIDGKAVAQKVRDEVKAGVTAFRAAHGRAPGLHVVLVGPAGIQIAKTMMK